MLAVLGYVLAAVCGWFGPGEVLLRRLGAPRRSGQTLMDPRRLLERNYLGWSLLAIALEALQGLLPVWLFRLTWPDSPWSLTVLLPLLGLASLRARPLPLFSLWAGWLLVDPLVVPLALLLLEGVYLLLRQARATTLAGLTLLPLLTALLHGSDGVRVAIAALVALVTAWLLPNDTADPPRFRGVLSLDGYLDPTQVGEEWVRLGQLQQQGLAVPPTWLLLPGHDPELLLEALQEQPERSWRLQGLVLNRSRRCTALVATAIAASAAALPARIYSLLNRIQAALAADAAGDYGLIALQPLLTERCSGWAAVDDRGERTLEGLPGDRQRLETTSLPCDRYRYEQDRWRPQPGCRGDLPRAVVERVGALLSAVSDNLEAPVRIAWSDDGERAWLQRVFVNVKSTD